MHLNSVKDCILPLYVVQFDGQVAVTLSNKVYTWGCHPYNLRFVAHAARKARQAGKFMGDPVERYLLPEVVDTGYVHGRITKVGIHTWVFYFVVSSMFMDINFH